jgi:hypothetical protein
LLHSQKLLLLSFIYSSFLYLHYRIPPENPFSSIYSESLIKTACRHLLLLVGFDTLIYRKYYDTPPILVGHHPLTSPFRLYNLSDAKALNQSVFSQKSSAAPLPSKTNFGGQKSLFWHPAGMGNCLQSHLHRRHYHLHRRCCLL